MNTEPEEKNSKACNFFTNIWVSILIAILVVYVSGYCSVESLLIKEYIDSIELLKPKTMVPPLQLFWGIIPAFILLSLFIGNQAQSNKLTKKAQQRLIGKSDDLIGKSNDLIQKSNDLADLIKTMPAKEALRKYSTIFKDILLYYKILLKDKNPSKKGVEKLIRTILFNLLEITVIFDIDACEGDTYAANIMYFTPLSDFSDNKKKRIKNKILFNDGDYSQLKGLLTLDKKLSTKVDFESLNKIEIHDEDDELPQDSLYLPVPKTFETHTPNDEDNRFNALPGAPLAFSTGNPLIYENIENIEKWFDEFGNFTPQIIDEVIEYFKIKRNTIGSFLSIPLINNDKSGSKTIGVLNIHVNKEDLLENEKLSEQFITLATPIIDILSELTDTWIKK